MKALGQPLGRRAFLLGAGAAGLGVACSGATTGDVTEEEVTGITRLDRLAGDLAIAALASSLENLAVATYDAVRKRLADGKLEALPPALARYVGAAAAHHEEHAKAWNGVVTGAGRPGVTGVNLTLKTRLEPMIVTARDYVGVATVFLELESITAATYLAGIAAMSNNAALKIASSVHTVELQHVAFLNLLLDRPPVPDSFAKTDGARSTTDTVG